MRGLTVDGALEVNHLKGQLVAKMIHHGERRARRQKFWRDHSEKIKTVAGLVAMIAVMAGVIFAGIHRMDIEDEAREAALALGDFEPAP